MTKQTANAITIFVTVSGIIMNGVSLVRWVQAPSQTPLDIALVFVHAAFIVVFGRMLNRVLASTE